MPVRSQTRELSGAAVLEEAGLVDGTWLEVRRVREPGLVGGYWHEASGGRPALIVCLPGASSFYDDGMVAKARDYHQNLLTDYRDAGFSTWTLALRECGTPYAGGDLDDLREALDWLQGGGAAELGVRRVYVLGYSSGGILASLAAMEYDLAGAVTVAGLSSGATLERIYPLVHLIAVLYPDNAAMCQLGATLDAYGRPGSPGWLALDVVGRVRDVRSPLLIVHGRNDRVFPQVNALALQATVEAIPPDERPPVEFFVAPTATHYNVFYQPDVVARILAFLETREAAADAP